ncbi:MAG: hypothetical protein RIC36_18535 [Rhodospirillales bacterium]
MTKYTAVIFAAMLAMTSLLAACDDDADLAENANEVVNDTKRAIEDATD